MLVTRPNDEKENRALHGLTRTLVANMVEGVANGFKKQLDVNGVGYRVQKQGKDLIMTLGYSHLVIVSEIPGITIEAPSPEQDHHFRSRQAACRPVCGRGAGEAPAGAL